MQNTYQSVDQLVLASEVVDPLHPRGGGAVVVGEPLLDRQRQQRDVLRQHRQRQRPREGGHAGDDGRVGPDVPGQPVHRQRQHAARCTGSAGTACTYGASTQSFLLINYLTNGTGGSPVFTYTLQGGEVCAGPPPGSATTTVSRRRRRSGRPRCRSTNPTAAISVRRHHLHRLGAHGADRDGHRRGGLECDEHHRDRTDRAAANGASVYDSSLTTVPNSLPTTVERAPARPPR